MAGGNLQDQIGGENVCVCGGGGVMAWAWPGLASLIHGAF